MLIQARRFIVTQYAPILHHGTNYDIDSIIEFLTVLLYSSHRGQTNRLMWPPMRQVRSAQRKDKDLLSDVQDIQSSRCVPAAQTCQSKAFLLFREMSKSNLSLASCEMCLSLAVSLVVRRHWTHKLSTYLPGHPPQACF